MQKPTFENNCRNTGIFPGGPAKMTSELASEALEIEPRRRRARERIGLVFRREAAREGANSEANC